MFIGVDSEHGLFHNNRLINALGVVPGTKEEPVSLPSGGAIQLDCTMLEWNSPVADTQNEFVIGVQSTKNDCIGLLGPEYSMGFDSRYDYTAEDLADESAWRIGCSPDFNAWKFTSVDNMRACMNPKRIYKELWRPAGAHIHISPFGSEDRAAKFIRLLDLFLGVPSLVLDPDMSRRQYYGTAGSFRFKTYPNGMFGVEYRALGPFWTKDAKLLSWVHNTVSWVYRVLKDLDEPSENITTIINKYRVLDAIHIINTYGLKLPL